MIGGGKMSQLHEGEDLSGERREPKVARGCMKCELNCESWSCGRRAGGGCYASLVAF